MRECLLPEGLPNGSRLPCSAWLTNPAYKGSYRYRQLGQDEISIPVPILVDEDTWQTAQDQLADNGLFSRRNNQRHEYLLRGLVRCPRCGGSYTGYTRGGCQGYRCNRISWASSLYRQSDVLSGSIQAQPLERAVWEAIKNALRNPQVLVDEYNRRLASSTSGNQTELERRGVASALTREKAQEDRITQAYIHDAMDLERYKEEMDDSGCGGMS